jgi:hypothetical protein
LTYSGIGTEGGSCTHTALRPPAPRAGASAISPHRHTAGGVGCPEPLDDRGYTPDRTRTCVSPSRRLCCLGTVRAPAAARFPDGRGGGRTATRACSSAVVLMKGIEPLRPCGHRLLRTARLPDYATSADGCAGATRTLKPSACRADVLPITPHPIVAALQRRAEPLGGAEEARTPDLDSAIVARSQLRYCPSG